MEGEGRRGARDAEPERRASEPKGGGGRAGGRARRGAAQATTGPVLADRARLMTDDPLPRTIMTNDPLPRTIVTNDL